MFTAYKKHLVKIIVNKACSLLKMEQSHSMLQLMVKH
jgi:hypothetical protein